MGAYKAIIGCNWNQFVTGSTEPDRYLALDLQEEPTITASATLCQQPLQSGDTMTDHMYRNPTTIQLSGMFSLNGSNVLNKDTSYNFFQTSQDRLTAIQEIFEKIKDDGILCRITTLKDGKGGDAQNNDNAQVRFKERNNMALSSITWTQMQNSMKFSFTFNEVIMVEVQEYEELTDELLKELNLPRVTSPLGSSLSTVLSNTGGIEQIVVQSLYNNGYIDNDFAQALIEFVDYVGTFVLAGLVAAGAIAAISAIAGSTAAALAISGSAAVIFPVGTIVAVAVVAVVAVVSLISSWFNRAKEREKQRKVFKLINGSAEQDAIRLRNLLDDINNAVIGVTTNITIYEIDPKDTNTPQQVMINLGGDYFTIDFQENNTKSEYGWTAQVYDLNDNPVRLQHNWCPQTSLADLKRNQNMWFRSGQYEVYLINANLNDIVNSTDEEKKNVAKRLHSYTIWVSYGNVEENAKIIENAINDAIVNEGFI